MLGSVARLHLEQPEAEIQEETKVSEAVAKLVVPVGGRDCTYQSPVCLCIRPLFVVRRFPDGRR